MTRVVPRTAKPRLRRGPFVSLQQLEDRSVPAIFANPTTQSFGSALNNNGHVATADFNSDGNLDLVLTNYGSSKAPSGSDDPGNSVTILFGTSTGFFTGATKYTVGGSTQFVSFAAAGDLNGDSKPDIVAVHTGTASAGSASSFSVFLNKGDGTFNSAATTVTGAANATWVGLADLNGDTFQDIAITHLGRDAGSSIDKNNVSIYTGNSTAGKSNGTFSLSNTYTTNFEFIPTAGVFLDIDSDGDLDLAVTIPTSPPDDTVPQGMGKIAQLINTSGVFAISGSYPSTEGFLPIGIAAADVDNNGKMDLVVANAGDPDAGNFGPNGTGKFGQGSSVSVLTNSGFGSFSTKTVLTASLRSAFAVAVGDFNLDSNADVAIADFGAPLGIDSSFNIFSSENGSLVVFTGNGAGGFALDSDYTYNGEGTQYLAVGDFDNKGTPDVVTVGLENRTRTSLNTTRTSGTVLAAPGTATLGQSVTLTATVAFTNGFTGTPTGNVRFFDGTTDLGTAPLANVSGQQKATLNTTALPLGNRTITARYEGDFTASPFTGVSVSTPTVIAISGSANTAPTISDVSNASTTTGLAVGPFSFTVNDAETAAGSLSVTAASTNTGLVPVGAITFGGSGSNRTVSITPAAGQTGTSTITLSVSDGSLSASDTFVLTVSTAANTPPTIGAINDASTSTGTAAGPFGFTVGDAETTAAALTLTATSSNTTLVPTANIFFGGSGASRTVLVSPAAGQSGSSTITVTVSDGNLITSEVFVLTVTAPNTPPTISNLNDATTTTGTTAGPFSITVGDAETSIGSLTLSATSSNITLVPNANVFFGGSGANRTVLVSPAAGQTGASTITVTVSDGSLSASDTFVLTVTASNTAPAVVVATSSVSPTNATLIPFTATFNEAVTGFSITDLTVINGTVQNFFEVNSSTYTFEVIPSDDGTVSVSVPAAVANDGQGLGNTASAIASVVADQSRPSATITSTSSPGPIATASFPVTVTFSEPVSGFAASDVVLTNGALSNFTFNGSTASFTVTAAANGIVTVGFPMNISQDVASNGNLAPTALSIAVAVNTAPTISNVSDQTTTLGTAIAPIAFTVGDAETSAAALTVSVSSSNSTVLPNANAVLSGTGAGRTLTLTPAAGQTGASTVTVTVTDAGGLTAMDTFIVTVIAPVVVLPPPVQGGLPREFAIGRDAGGSSSVRLFNPDRSERFNLTPFGADFTGGIRTATADFNGDGIAELVAGSGAGTVGHVKVFDGATGAEIFDLLPFGETFRRGVVVSAGDMTRDGRAELVITAESGGGARVRIFTPDAAGSFRQLADFFALIGGDGIADTNFRGGGRSAVGDFNGDGFGDLAFAAGTGGGPRIAIFDGSTIALNSRTKLRGDFFVFEPKLRNGSYIAAGDLNGDGFAELVAGGGPGGGPRVSVLSGKDLVAGRDVRLKDFFAGDERNRGGIRVAVKNLDGDRLADILVGSGAGGGSRATAYLGAPLLSGSTPVPLFDFDAFPGFDGGIYVG